MCEIRLYFDTAKTDCSSVLAWIDSEAITANVRSDHISIIGEITCGIHQISLQLARDQEYLSILDVIIDGISLKHQIYLSWITLPDQVAVQQPATDLYNTSVRWTLPFGLPLTYWETLLQKKLPGNIYGTDLYHQYHIYYPEFRRLSNKFPPLIQQFFQYDFDFVLTPRSADLRQLPWAHTNIGRPNQAVADAAIEELLANRNLFTVLENHNSQLEELWLKKYDQELVGSDRLPATWHLIHSLDLNGLRAVYFGILPANAYLAQHTDNDPRKKMYEDVYYLYFTLTPQSGNHLKFSNAGIFSGSEIVHVNNAGHIHSVINDSTEDRIAMALYVDRLANPNIQLTAPLP